MCRLHIANFVARPDLVKRYRDLLAGIRRASLTEQQEGESEENFAADWAAELAAAPDGDPGDDGERERALQRQRYKLVIDALDTALTNPGYNPYDVIQVPADAANTRPMGYQNTFNVLIELEQGIQDQLNIVASDPNILRELNEMLHLLEDLRDQIYEIVRRLSRSSEVTRYGLIMDELEQALNSPDFNPYAEILIFAGSVNGGIEYRNAFYVLEVLGQGLEGLISDEQDINVMRNLLSMLQRLSHLENKINAAQFVDVTQPAERQRFLEVSQRLQDLNQAAKAILAAQLTPATINQDQINEINAIITEYESNIMLEAEDVLGLKLSSDDRTIISQGMTNIENRINRMRRLIPEARPAQATVNPATSPEAAYYAKTNKLVTDFEQEITAVETALANASYDPRNTIRPVDVAGKEENYTVQQLLEYYVNILQRMDLRTFDPATGDYLIAQGLIRRAETLQQRILQQIENLQETAFNTWQKQIATEPWAVAAETVVNQDLSGITTDIAAQQALQDATTVLTNFDQAVTNLPTTALGYNRNNQQQRDVITDRRRALVERIGEIQALVDRFTQTRNVEKFKIDFSKELVVWEGLVAEIPESRQAMMKEGMSMPELKQLRDNLITEYNRLQTAGVLNRTGVGEEDRVIDAFERRAQQLIQQHTRELLTPLDPQTMSIQEVVSELMDQTAIYDSDRFKALKNRYEAGLGEVEDYYQQSLLKDGVATTAAAIDGTSRSKDWAHNLNHMIKPFAGNGGTPQTLAMLYFKDPNRPVGIKDFENGVAVDVRAIAMWRFITSRIKDNEKFGGVGKGHLVEAIHDQIIDAAGNPTNATRARLADHSGNIRMIQRETHPDYQERLRKTRDAIQAGDRAAVVKLVPQRQGETTADYQSRIDEIMDENPVEQAYRVVGGSQVVRIQGEPDHEFQTRLSKIAKLDQPFAYGVLNEHVADDFTSIIKLVFADIPIFRRLALLNYYKAFGAKSVGYQPYLGRGTTRGHGFSPGETLRKDESAYSNRFSLDLYNATRYDRLSRARFMRIFQFVDRDQFIALVAQSFDDNWLNKARSAEEVHDLFELYLFTRFSNLPPAPRFSAQELMKHDKLPLWITEARKLFMPRHHLDLHLHLHGKDDAEALHALTPAREKRLFEGAIIDLDQPIFPLLPEMTSQVMELEARKRQLIADITSGRITESAFNTAVNDFVEEFKHQGYFNYRKLKEANKKYKDKKFKDEKEYRLAQLDAMFGQNILFGGHESPNFSAVQFEIASTQLEGLFDAFEKPMDPDMDKGAVEGLLRVWIKDYMGKAKLVPGKHQLLFAPLTCAYITDLLHNYESGHLRHKVNSLYRELMSKYVLVGGLPGYVVEEIVRLMGGDLRNAPPYCIAGPRDRYKMFYMRKLWEIETEEDDDLSHSIKRAIPLYSEGEFKPPYEHEHAVEKDASGKAEVKH
jgi:hypothetical protein